MSNRFKGLVYRSLIYCPAEILKKYFFTASDVFWSNPVGCGEILQVMICINLLLIWQIYANTMFYCLTDHHKQRIVNNKEVFHHGACPASFTMVPAPSANQTVLSAITSQILQLADLNWLFLLFCFSMYKDFVLILNSFQFSSDVLFGFKLLELNSGI